MLNPLCHYSPMLDFNFFQLVRYFHAGVTSSVPRGLQPLQNIDLEDEIAATNILISFKALLKKSGRRRSQFSPHHKLATPQSVIYLI